jgi:hypothetical protein
MTTSRTPAGTPAGGQFAASGHTEADQVALVGQEAPEADGPRFRQPDDPTDPRARLIGDGFTDSAGTRWTTCEDCSATVYAYRGSNEWLENGTDDGECGSDWPRTGKVHSPSERIAIPEVRNAEEKVTAIRTEIADMASADPSDRRIGSVKLHDAVQRLAAAEVEADLWDRVQVRLDANPAEFPTVDSAIASVYDQVLDEIIDSGANDTASGRAGDIRRVRFDAERTWLSRRRLQGQVPTRS